MVCIADGHGLGAPSGQWGCNVPKLGGSLARSRTGSQIANKITVSMALIAGHDT